MLNSEIDVSKCEYYYEYPSNDIECNSALEGDSCKKVCHNKDCKWSLCSENIYCEYKVSKQLQQLKQENENTKLKLEQYKKSKQASYEAMQRKSNRLELENRELKKELKSVENDRVWIKEKCIDAGKELGKYSFVWDGKEKNLVVQAMQLNEMYEQLKAENGQLYKEKEQLQKSQYCVAYEKDCHLVCKQSSCKLKDYHKYKQCLDEIEKIANDDSFPSDFDVYEERDFYFNQLCKIDNILQKIKQVKEGD